MRSLNRGVYAGAILSVVVTMPMPAHATGPQIAELRSFVDCLNTKIGVGNDAEMSSTVQCLPANCTMTLTMSEESAQPACSSGGDDGAKKCQLPRIILNCPGPPPFIPSYSLCPSGGTSNHFEVGVMVSRRNNFRMIMGDIDLPPGPYKKIGLQSVKSLVPDSKGCNNCHDNGNPGATNGTPQQSIAIDTFGEFAGTQLGPLVIDTNEPGRTVKPGPGITPQTLADVCGCIDDAVNDDLHPLAGEFPVQRLCNSLLNYQMTRGWK